MLLCSPHHQNIIFQGDLHVAKFSSHALSPLLTRPFIGIYPNCSLIPSMGRFLPLASRTPHSWFSCYLSAPFFSSLNLLFWDFSLSILTLMMTSSKLRTPNAFVGQKLPHPYLQSLTPQVYVQPPAQHLYSEV